MPRSRGGSAALFWPVVIAGCSSGAPRRPRLRPSSGWKRAFAASRARRRALSRAARAFSSTP
eukprot:11184982-Lingulodinium_polyedra.AAC.1